MLLHSQQVARYTVMRQRFDWKREIDKQELKYGVILLLLYLAAIMLATAGCSRKAVWKPDHAAENVKPRPLAPKPVNAAPLEADLSAPTLSGRKLTIEKNAQKHSTSRHFDDDVYGVSFDFPKSYDLREGDLPDMDRGLGYLGRIPMEFAAPGGVRLATVEVPRGAHLGTDFVNAFFTVSVSPNVTAAQCIEFHSIEGGSEPARSRTIDGIAFHAVKESATASMHQYSGTFLHGYAEESCYEIGYGIATAGYGAIDGLKKVNNEAIFHHLEKILDSVTLNPPQIESNSTPSDASAATSSIK